MRLNESKFIRHAETSSLEVRFSNVFFNLPCVSGLITWITLATGFFCVGITSRFFLLHSSKNGFHVPVSGRKKSCSLHGVPRSLPDLPGAGTYSPPSVPSKYLLSQQAPVGEENLLSKLNECHLKLRLVLPEGEEGRRNRCGWTISKLVSWGSTAKNRISHISAQIVT
jgi:hypothetical protein